MRTKYFYIGIFFIFLALFSTFATKTSFHDSNEFITVAKNFAGIKNTDLFVGHSVLYPFILSLFLKILPSITMLKLVNSMWIFFIGVVLFLWLKNKKAFILFAFSPLTWYMSIQTTPILPASFFFLLSFIFFNRRSAKHSFLYSGLFLGLACAFYTPMILFSAIFVMIYFWKKDFSSVILYLIAALIGFSPRLILEWILFDNPLYSLIRYGGANFIVSIGIHPSTSIFEILHQFGVLIIIIAISPFLFRIHRLELRKYQKLILFLILSGLIILIRAAKIKYFLIVAPIVLLLLSFVLTKKEIKWHCIISVVLVFLFTFSFFIPFQNNNDSLIKNDLQNIIADYNPVYIVGGPFEGLEFAALLWKNKPYFVWWQDFEAALENRTKMRGYDFELGSEKLKLREKLVISASFNRFENKTYEDYIIVTQKSEEEFPELSDFKLKNCYEVLCVYGK